MDRLNRNLTSKDLENAVDVLVQVFADENYPMFVSLKGKQLEDIKNIDNDNIRRVTNWRFEVNSDAEGSVEYKELEDCKYINDKGTDYHIVIGQA